MTTPNKLIPKKQYVKPTLQEVTDEGSSTTNDVTLTGSSLFFDNTEIAENPARGDQLQILTDNNILIGGAGQNITATAKLTVRSTVVGEEGFSVDVAGTGAENIGLMTQNGQLKHNYFVSAGHGQYLIYDSTGSIGARIAAGGSTENYFLQDTAFGKDSALELVDVEGAIRYKTAYSPSSNAGNQSGTYILDADTATHFSLTATGALALTISNLDDGQTVDLTIIGNGVQQTLTMNTSVVWFDGNSGTPPVMPTATTDRLKMSFLNLNGTIEASFTGNYQVTA